LSVIEIVSIALAIAFHRRPNGSGHQPRRVLCAVRCMPLLCRLGPTAFLCC
jgi:hypothetical protein